MIFRNEGLWLKLGAPSPSLAATGIWLQRDTESVFLTEFTEFVETRWCKEAGSTLLRSVVAIAEEI